MAEPEQQQQEQMEQEEEQVPRFMTPFNFGLTRGK